MGKGKTDDNITQVDVNVVRNGKKHNYSFDLSEELRISPARINDHLGKNQEQLGWFSTVHAYLKTMADEAEAELEDHKANLMVKLTEEAGPKSKVTELRELIKTDNTTKELAQKYRDIKLKERIVRGAVEAFKGRKDCLVSLAANFREDSDPTLSVKKKKK
ncbi:MAG: hypothetical protein GWN86_10050 [Desulfobacterales bacterium]|nr:hypothetical protein [Desulfobacterales bacterium]